MTEEIERINKYKVTFDEFLHLAREYRARFKGDEVPSYMPWEDNIRRLLDGNFCSGSFYGEVLESYRQRKA